MTKQKYYIAIVEDEPTTRKRLKDAVQQSAELKVVATAGNCEQGRKIIKEHKLDVLLVDLGLPDGHGTELIRLSQEISPDTEIMVITIFGDEKSVITAIEAGATGYLIKDSNAEHIADSIKQILQGGSPISASIARHLLKRFNPRDQLVEEQPLLTKREREVLELITKGFSYAEIAYTLEISVHTATSHIKHIYRKLSVHSRGEAVFEAIQLGLIKPIS